MDSIKKTVELYAKENIAKVNVFIKDPFVKKYIREEKISWVTFLGSIGGNLGLLSGFSAITAFEIVYLLIVSFFN